MMHWLMDTAAGSVVFLLMALSLGLILYFVPTIIALVGHHPLWFRLAALNLLLAWTILGWVLLLAWALMRNDSPTFDQGES